jgi:hypothetical protein
MRLHELVEPRDVLCHLRKRGVFPKDVLYHLGKREGFQRCVGPFIVAEPLQKSLLLSPGSSTPVLETTCWTQTSVEHRSKPAVHIFAQRLQAAEQKYEHFV